MYRFKSIRSFIALAAGGCLLVVVMAVLAYALVAMDHLQEASAARTRAELRKTVEARLQARAEQQAQAINARLQSALQVARELASTNAMMGSTDGRPPLLPISRHTMSMIVRQRVIDNPDLLDAFIGWTPNAFDNDADFAGMTSWGYNERGRFCPGGTAPPRTISGCSICALPKARSRLATAPAAVNSISARATPVAPA